MECEPRHSTVKRTVAVTLRKLREDWVPPILRRAMRQFRARRDTSIRFEGTFATWAEAEALCLGYGHERILQRVLEATLRVVRGEAAFERDSCTFSEPAYSWPLMSMLLRVALRNNGELRVLDFGGALGSTYFQHKRLLSDVHNLEWCVVEQPHFVEAGRNFVQDCQLKFFEGLAAVSQLGRLDIVLASSVLQYMPDPEVSLSQLASLGAEAIVLERTCFNRQHGEAALRIQHVPPTIYQASYPCWFLDEARLDQIVADRGYELIADFPALDRLDARAEWKGKIFVRRST